jgi:hypothetical protein
MAGLQGREIVVTATHDAAMLSRITATIALHPVATFSYTPSADGVAAVRIDVLGGEWQETRVLQKVRRIIGVLDARFTEG